MPGFERKSAILARSHARKLDVCLDKTMTDWSEVIRKTWDTRRAKYGKRGNSVVSFPSPPTKGQGRGIALIRALIADAPPTCVTWPLFRDENGYGRLGYLGKQWWAHTLVCTLVNGDRPTPDHEATHSCGNGKEGCYNPRHLTWGTRTRNQLDRKFHGTKAKGYKGSHRQKLTQADVDFIRSQKGLMTQRALAEKFGVTDATIRDIYSGKSWNPAARRMLTVADVLEIRKLAEYISNAEIAQMFKMSEGGVWNIVSGRSYADLPQPAKARA